MNSFPAPPAEAPWFVRWAIQVASWLASRLADDVQSGWRWVNTYLIATLMTAPAAYELLDPKYKALVSASWLHWGEAAVGAATFINLLRKKTP